MQRVKSLREKKIKGIFLVQASSAVSEKQLVFLGTVLTSKSAS